MRKAKVSELKAKLSSYLADVRKGDTLIVCDRATPIARIVPVDQESEGWAICEPGRSIRELKKIRPVRLRKEADVDAILREIRGER